MPRPVWCASKYWRSGFGSLARSSPLTAAPFGRLQRLAKTRARTVGGTFRSASALSTGCSTIVRKNRDTPLTAREKDIVSAYVGKRFRRARRVVAQPAVEAPYGPQRVA